MELQEMTWSLDPRDYATEMAARGPILAPSPI